MVSKMKRMWSLLDLEERILNLAAILSLVSFFFPWLSGEWLGGDTVTYTGFGFYTSFVGIFVFILLLALLLITLVPFFGGPVLLRRKQRDILRLGIATQSTVLLITILSVLVKVTYDFSRIEIRFGIYVALIGSIVVTIYSFLRWQEDRKSEVHGIFHHPEDHIQLGNRPESHSPPSPPPPPPPLQPEEHHFHA